MRLTVKKALNFVNVDQQENIWDEFTKSSKKGPSMESLNDDFSQFSVKMLF